MVSCGNNVGITGTPSSGASTVATGMTATYVFPLPTTVDSDITACPIIKYKKSSSNSGSIT